MLKSLLVYGLIFTLGINMNSFKQGNALVDYFNSCDNICIYFDNIKHCLNNNEQIKIKEAILKVCKDSHEMPALGVSIHDETMKAIKSGAWIIFKYNTLQEHNELPFDELLINVNTEDFGFNIIRGNNNKYNGRCYYLSLSNNMSELYSTITSLLNKKTTR